MSKQIDFKKQENKNINIKKGFSSVLLLDIPLKDFSLNEANNNILNNSMEKIIESFDCSMDSPCSEKEWEDYEKLEKEAEELAKKGISVDYS